jgi:hypothetical protein
MRRCRWGREGVSDYSRAQGDWNAPEAVINGEDVKDTVKVEE